MRTALSLGLCAVAGLAAGVGHATQTPELRLEGMVFVGSRGSERDVVIHSESAVYAMGDHIARLRGVRAEVSADDARDSFSLTCDRAELNLDSYDFIGEGHVEGRTDEGQHYSAPWVRFDHDQGLLYSDTEARMVDDTGTFRGDGFRYYVHERRFQLLGNVRVEQRP